MHTHAHREKDGSIDSLTDRQTERQTNRQIDRQIDRQTDAWIHVAGDAGLPEVRP